MVILFDTAHSYAMPSEQYRMRQDILHTHVLHIEDLIKDCSALSIECNELNLQLKTAKTVISQLKAEIDCMADEKIDLAIRLDEAANEAARLGLVLKRQDVNRQSVVAIGYQARRISRLMAEG